MDDYSNLVYIDPDGVGWFIDENGELYPVELPEDFEIPDSEPPDVEPIFDGNEWVDRDVSDQELFDDVYSDDEEASTGYSEYDVTVQDFLDGESFLSPLVIEDGEETDISPGNDDVFVSSAIIDAIGIVDSDSDDVFDADYEIIPDPIIEKRPSPFDLSTHTPVTMTSSEREEYDTYWDDLIQSGFIPQSYANRPAYN